MAITQVIGAGGLGRKILEVELSSATSTIEIDNISLRQHRIYRIMIIAAGPGSGTFPYFHIYLNNDFNNANYRYERLSFGGSVSSSTNRNPMLFQGNDISRNFMDIEVSLVKPNYNAHIRSICMPRLPDTLNAYPSYIVTVRYSQLVSDITTITINSQDGEASGTLINGFPAGTKIVVYEVD